MEDTNDQTQLMESVTYLEEDIDPKELLVKKEKKQRRSRSLVWKFCDKLSDKLIICRLCNKTFKSCGNTTNAALHVKRYHSKELGDDDFKVPEKTFASIVTDATSNYSADVHSPERIEIVCTNVSTDTSVSHSGKENRVEHTRAVITKPAPPWEGIAVVDGEFIHLKSSDFLGKYVVLFFYPLDFVFDCPIELREFNDSLATFKNLNTEVIACSIDSHFTHLAWIRTSRKLGGLGNVDIPLLSDLHHKISISYDIFSEDLGHTLRGLFIIDPKGILRHMTVNDLSEACSIDETIRLVQSLQKKAAS